MGKKAPPPTPPPPAPKIYEATQGNNGAVVKGERGSRRPRQRHDERREMMWLCAVRASG